MRRATTKLTPEPKMTCAELHDALEVIFPKEGFLHMREVRDATGFDSSRSADHMALGMYKSRGRLLWGFEIKVTRSDWLKELEQPSKAESWMRYCDHWALVIADESMVRPGELPSTWGMYAPVRGKLKCIVPAPTLDPANLGRIPLTALMYAASKSDDARVSRLIREAQEAAVKGERSSQGWRAEELEKLQARVKAFEEASGLHISYRDPEKLKALGEIVKAVQSGKTQMIHRMSSIDYAIRTLEEILPDLRTQHANLKAAQNLFPEDEEKPWKT